MIQAVLFDLDLTLLDRDRMYRNFAYEQAAKYTDDVEKAAQYIIDRDEHGYGDHEAAYAAMISRWHMPVTVSVLQKAWVDFMKYGVIPYAHAAEVLEQLSREYRLGIVTNGGSDTQWGKIDHSGLKPYFDVIVVSEDVQVEKPDARIFHCALEALGITAAEAVYVGDHLINDVQGALHAGIRPVWIDHGQNKAVEDCIRIHSLEELPKVIRNMGGMHE